MKALISSGFLDILLFFFLIKMTGFELCTSQSVALCLTSVGLLISTLLNVALFLLHRKNKKKSANETALVYEDEAFHQHILRSDRFEEDEMERQDNPIYGNICLEGGGAFEKSLEVCYEQMSQTSTIKNLVKAEVGDVSYASLDLAANRKHKKKRKYQRQNQHQAQMHHPQAGSQQNIQEQDGEAEVPLPSRSSSLMVSRHSIYLNSHQLALEAEGREREREKTEREGDDENAESQFEVHKELQEDFVHSLRGSRQSMEQDSLQFES